MVTKTSIEAYESILPELGERQQFVLNGLKTLGTSNNKLIAHTLRLGINQVTARMMELRDMKLVTFVHEAPCPMTMRNTKWWKCTKYGEELGEIIEKPQEEILIIRPFILTEGDYYTRYTAQIKSSIAQMFYNVELKRIWDLQLKEFYFEKFCECKAFEFNKDCKHCHRLESELKRWNEI